jgi:FixJ family two-component response regulator
LGRVRGRFRDVERSHVVLVVDDDFAVLRATKHLLRQHEYEPILFSSAQAFYEE